VSRTRRCSNLATVGRVTRVVATAEPQFPKGAAVLTRSGATDPRLSCRRPGCRCAAVVLAARHHRALLLGDVGSGTDLSSSVDDLTSSTEEASSRLDDLEGRVEDACGPLTFVPEGTSCEEDARGGSCPCASRGGSPFMAGGPLWPPPENTRTGCRLHPFGRVAQTASLSRSPQTSSRDRPGSVRPLRDCKRSAGPLRSANFSAYRRPTLALWPTLPACDRALTPPPPAGGGDECVQA
jgi:hypothetical protein